MPAAHAGSFPEPMNDYWNSFIKSNKKATLSSTINGMENDLTGGWHPKRPKGWKNKAKREGKSEFIELRDLNGRKRRVRRYVYDIDDHMYFHPTTNENATQYVERQAMVDHAFNDDSVKDNVISEEGCGHISKLEYAKKEQILRVTFENGAVCSFFKVPTSVAGTLLHSAKTKQSYVNASGKEVHLLGVYFWRFVRHMKSRIGAKYPFEYESHGYTSTGGNRHLVHLTREQAMSALATVVAADSPVAKRLAAQIKMAGNNPNQKFVVELTDDEYKAIGDTGWQNLAKASLENEGLYYNMQGTGAANAFVTGNAHIYGQGADENGDEGMGYQHDYAVMSPEDEYFYKQEHADLYNDSPKMGVMEDVAHSVYDLAEKARRNLEDRLMEYVNTPEYTGAVLAEAEANAQKPSAAMKDFITDKLGDKGLADNIRSKRYGTDNLDSLRIRDNVTPRDRKALISAAFGAGTLPAWEKEHLPAKSAFRKLGRVWTINELKDFVNKDLNSTDLTAYMRYINAQDWRGALGFLKDHGTTMKYVDPHTHAEVALKTKTTYASPADVVMGEDGTIL